MTKDYYYNWGTRQSDDPEWKIRNAFTGKVVVELGSRS